VRNKISYEWVVSLMDIFGDIHAQDYFETYAEALNYQADSTYFSSMVELWRYEGNDDSGLKHKEMYEVIDGKLDAELPKFILKQLTNPRN